MPRFLETKDDFAAALAEAGDKVVVIDFTASWCGPCQIISPKFEEFSKQYTSCEFFKVDVDNNTEVAEEQRITAMPTFVFFRNSKRIDEMVGSNAAKLEEKISLYNK